MSTPKGMALSKDEVTLLINLVEANKVITSKATNATNNQLKEVAWLKVTDAFNASVTSCPRRMEQLKLKWENLKKAARKRSASIRLNHNKTGGGKPDYIPPDDALDKVASILGATCEGYSVPYGGDADTKDSPVTESVLVDGGGLIIISGGDDGKGDGGDGSSNTCLNTTTPHEEKITKKFFFSTPSRSSSFSKRKRILDENDVKARIERNQAIKSYYNEKKRKLELEAENLELRNRKLKIELEKMNSL